MAGLECPARTEQPLRQFTTFEHQFFQSLSAPALSIFCLPLALDARVSPWYNIHAQLLLCKKSYPSSYSSIKDRAMTGTSSKRYEVTEERIHGIARAH